jgi:hypothetical protein
MRVSSSPRSAGGRRSCTGVPAAGTGPDSLSSPAPADFPPGLPFVWDERTLRGGTVFTLDTDLGRIDLLSEVAGLGDWNDIRKCRVRLPAFGREVWTLDLPSLIRAKRAAGRPKDLLVLPELESLLDAANDSGAEQE